MGTISTGLGQVLFGRTRLRLLGWLFSHPDEAYYLSELKRHTGVGQGALQRELAILTQAGVLERTTRGRHVFFTASRKNPIFEELRSILTKTSGIRDVLADALAPLARRIEVAFVFGSVALGTDGAASDVDLFVIGDVTFSEIVEALAAAQTVLGRDVNPTAYPTAEFLAKVSDGHHFVNSVIGEPKIFVIGGANELARLATVRMADHSPNQRKRNPRSAGRARSGSPRQRG